MTVITALLTFYLSYFVNLICRVIEGGNMLGDKLCTSFFFNVICKASESLPNLVTIVTALFSCYFISLIYTNIRVNLLSTSIFKKMSYTSFLNWYIFSLFSFYPYVRPYYIIGQ